MAMTSLYTGHRKPPASFAVLVAVVLTISCLPAAALEHVLEDVAIGLKDGRLSVELSFSTSPSYKSFRMDDRNFIVYDFYNTVFHPGKKDIKPDDPVIREISIGQFKPDVARVVLRLNSARSFDAEALDKSLVLTLVPLKDSAETATTPVPPVKPVQPAATPAATVVSSPAPDSKDPAKTAAPATVTPTPPVKPVQPAATPAATVVSSPAPDSKDPAKTAAPATKPALADELKLAKNREPVKIQSEKPAPYGIPTTSATKVKPASKPAPKPQPIKNANGKRYIPIVVIDPGHGGNDPGAVVAGTQEKDIDLAIATRLKEKLDATNSIKAFLTRTDDQMLTLEARTRIARMYYADLFISIHADSVADTAVKGIGIYYLSNRGASSKAAAILAAKENAVAAIVADVSLSDNPKVFSILMDLEQTKTIKDSAVFAGQIERAVTADPVLTLHGVHQASFVVLQSIDIPSVLIEVGFLSNDKERENLKKSVHQDRIAEAIKNACESFLFSYMLPSHRQTGKH